MNNKTIENAIRAIIAEVGEDPKREGLLKTPERVAKSFKFLTSGYEEEKEVLKDCKDAIFNENVRSVVAIKNIEFYSLCEHHLLPFWGEVTIAFIPNKSGHILGLSKFARLVDLYTKRFQVQERLTEQLIDVLEDILKPQALCVRTDANHMCMMMRGVQKHGSRTSIYQFRGKKNLEQSLRDELAVK